MNPAPKRRNPAGGPGLENVESNTLCGKVYTPAPLPQVPGFRAEQREFPPTLPPQVREFLRFGPTRWCCAWCSGPDRKFPHKVLIADRQTGDVFEVPTRLAGVFAKRLGADASIVQKITQLYKAEQSGIVGWA
jgi:hypothetical protein